MDVRGVRRADAARPDGEGFGSGGILLAPDV